jgi:hypothetical protein
MIVYCIVCNITGEKYYGSTKQTLEQRRREHKCKNNTCCSKQITERGDYNIYTLHEYDTEEEAKLKEGWYIDNKECINLQRACVTKEDIQQYKKEYCKNNPEQYRESRKKFYKKNREKISEKGKETIECEFCKFIGVKRELKRHQKSKRCLKYQLNV